MQPMKKNPASLICSSTLLYVTQVDDALKCGKNMDPKSFFSIKETHVIYIVTLEKKGGLLWKKTTHFIT